MTLVVYDTKTRSKREFEPREPPDVLMYACGPTVYGPAHLGHARAYVAFDVVRRYLEFKGYKVRLVENFTDVEDSITRVAREKGVRPQELVTRNIESFLRDMDDLGVKRADFYPRVTEFIPEIVSTVKTLVDKGFAYASDGNVYFRVSKARSLGMLSHRDTKGMIADEMTPLAGRESALDFALWRKSLEGHPSWPSPWGNGRPGWHVECFAMSSKLLGPAIDLHCGGLDLIFPHHESEAMISEAFVEGDWCNYWLHNAFITIEREKMSKSLGNFVNLRDLLDVYKPEAVRLCMLKEQYRKNVEYERDCFKRTEEELARVHEAIEKARGADGPPSGGKAEAVVKSTRTRFFRAMDDDFDTADAVHVLMQFVEAVHELDSLSKEEGAQVTALFDDIGKVLGLFGAK
jgi:cysteinyl-tRNA synthetase